MTRASVVSIASANAPPSKLGLTLSQSGVVNAAISSALRKICGEKPWVYLMEKFGLSDGGARKKYQNARDFDPDEIGLLLWEPDGFLVLAAVMEAIAKHTGRPPPLWWRFCRPLLKSYDWQRMADMATREITKELRKAVENGRDIQQAIDHGRTALMVQDEEFYGPALEMERVARSGPAYRAVAAGRKTGRR
jgi:hypothetical protein